MKIIALPDLHGAVDRLQTISTELASADLVLLVGDLTNAGSASDAQHVIDSVRHFNPSILAVPGNWDGPEVNQQLSAQQVNLHRHHTIRDGIAFIGVGAALISPLHSPNEITEEDFGLFLEEASQGLATTTCRILVCHQPPLRTHTARAWSGLDLGSQAVRAYIEKTQPLLCFTGHVHEAIGLDWIDKTAIINPGPLWQNGYAFVEIEDRVLISSEIRKPAKPIRPVS